MKLSFFPLASFTPKTTQPHATATQTAQRFGDAIVRFKSPPSAMEISMGGRPLSNKAKKQELLRFELHEAMLHQRLFLHHKVSQNGGNEESFYLQYREPKWLKRRAQLDTMFHLSGKDWKSKQKLKVASKVNRKGSEATEPSFKRNLGEKLRFAFTEPFVSALTRLLLKKPIDEVVNKSSLLDNAQRYRLTGSEAFKLNDLVKEVYTAELRHKLEKDFGFAPNRSALACGYSIKSGQFAIVTT